MDYHAIICSQYRAALAMVEQAIQKCPDALWDAAEDKTKFWHVAYHALFYTQLYLQDTEKDFRPWAKYRKEYHFIGQLPWPPHRAPNIGEPYAKADILEYVEFCRELVDQRVPQTDLAAPSGFEWLPMTKFELQIYTIRHLQQHAGELMERLGSRANIDVDWVGMAA